MTTAATPMIVQMRSYLPIDFSNPEDFISCFSYALQGLSYAFEPCSSEWLECVRTSRQARQMQVALIGGLAS